MNFNPENPVPGIYPYLDNDVYHRSPGLSKSGLAMLRECPAKFEWRYILGNREDETKAMKIGAAFHGLVLEPELFSMNFAVSPKFDGRTKEGKAGKAAFAANHAGKAIIDEDDFSLIRAMAEAVLNPAAENLEVLQRQAPGYYDKRMQGKSDDWIKVNLGNQYGFVMDGKPVHPEYNDSVHCVDDVDWRPESPIVLGFDFGRTPACAILQEIGDSWYVLDEYCATHMSAAKFAPGLLNYLNHNYPGAHYIGWGDPAGANKGEVVEHSAIEMLNLSGIPCMPCDTQDPLQRRAAISAPLTQLAMNGHRRVPDAEMPTAVPGQRRALPDDPGDGRHPLPQ
jgi:hypothetical protein